MIGLCLVLLAGGTPAGAPPRPAPAPIELRLHRAVVVQAETLAQESPDLDPEDDNPPAAGRTELVPLRKAAVERDADPTKEHG